MSVLVCRFAVEVLARSTLDALALSVARAQSVAAEPRRTGLDDTIDRAIAAATAPGIIAFAPGFPVNGAPSRRAGRHFQPRHDELPASPLVQMAVARLLGFGERQIAVHGNPVVVAPDIGVLQPVLKSVLWLLLGLFVLSIVVAWVFASWLASQAIAPLVTLTRELERFGAGDFVPRPLRTSEAGELRTLIAAYNAAAVQVGDAFNERLEVEQHMRRFIADAGHELRTPLTVIAGYLEILRKGGVSDSSTCERALVTLTEEACRMRVLIDRLLALARLERPDVSELREVNVGDVAADAIAHVRAARGGDISLECAARVVVFADRAELAEAIENVVDNAVKYGRRSPVAVRVESIGGSAVVRVRDAGQGIPDNERSRLFERFFRGDDRGDIEGTGLGLAIAERAISRCSGRIVLEESMPGQTIFAITIPIAPARATVVAPLRL